MRASMFWVNYTFKRTYLHLPIEGALEAMTDMTPRGVGQLSLEPSRPFTMAQMEDLLLRLQLSGQPWSSCPIIQWGGNGTSPNASDITHSPLPKECLPRSINITDKQWPARTSSCAGLANASKDGWRWRRGEKRHIKAASLRVSHGKYSVWDFLEETRYTARYIENILVFVGGISIFQKHWQRTYSSGLDKKGLGLGRYLRTDVWIEESKQTWVSENGTIGLGWDCCLSNTQYDMWKVFTVPQVNLPALVSSWLVECSMVYVTHQATGLYCG